jgi:hypothetical protein
MMTEERREVGIDRVAVKRPVAICAGRAGSLLRGKTRDLSPRGMAIDVEGPLTPGEHLVFKLDLGADFSTVVEGGQVAWVVPGDGLTSAGVRFVSLTRRPSSGQLDAVVPAPAAGFQPGEELRVRVGGMGQSLRAEFVDQDGPHLLRFRCPLPFLKLRSPVTVRSAQGEGVTFEGEVGAVEASTDSPEGIPELLVTAWVGGADDVDLVMPGSVESAALSTPPQPMLSRDTLTDMEPVRDEVPSAPPEPAREVRDTLRDPPRQAASRIAIPIPPPSAGMPVAEESAPAVVLPDPAKAAEVGRKVGTAVAGAGRKTLTAAASAARGFRGRVGPFLARAAVLVLAALRTTGRTLYGLVGGAHRKWRRSHLPRTYSDVVGRAQKPAAPGGKTWAHRAALVMGVVGVGLAVWGILGARSADGRTTGDRPAAASPEAQAQPEVPSAPLPEVPSAWPSAGELPPPAVEPSPTPAEGAADWGSAPAAAAPPEAPAPPREAEESAAPAQPAPRAGRRGEASASTPAALNGGRSFVLRLDKPALRVANYGLRQPPGIVLDVLGAGPEGGESRIETGSNAVRLVKATPREDGTRFIIYLRSRTMPRYTVTPNGNEIQITIEE